MFLYEFVGTSTRTPSISTRHEDPQSSASQPDTDRPPSTSGQSTIDASISVNVSVSTYTNTPTHSPENLHDNSQAFLSHQQQQQQQSQKEKPQAEEAKLDAMISPFPFHTLNVHLLRGRNLVAKDACGK